MLKRATRPLQNSIRPQAVARLINHYANDNTMFTANIGGNDYLDGTIK
ncbi:hypothetical protein [Coxiella endosymbiont of Ornithodoros amblus]|nr:hypothetical protein [Coxiella endosymbiont of Ornithodoros amblus]